MKFIWLTDVHLNFLEKVEREAFYREIFNTQCDAVLISGDIAEANCVSDLLKEMANNLNKPIYFVLGNHDYYRGDVLTVHNEMISLTQSNNKLFWLPASGPILFNHTILIGQDGWADGRYGNYLNSDVGLNDSRLIADLFQKKMLGRTQLLEKMQELADNDAKKLRENINEAAQQSPKTILILTHIPPFKEACMHMGLMSDDNWLPFFSSKISGDVIFNAANQYPQIEFLVLCGHTHSEAHYQPLNNLTVKAGKAEYYDPKIQDLIVLS